MRSGSLCCNTQTFHKFIIAYYPFFVNGKIDKSLDHLTPIMGRKENNMKKRNNLARCLNLNYLELTNKTTACGEMDMPALFCNTKQYPDFLALYSEPGLYHHTERTAVCFYEFDSVFDGKKGLYTAIHYGDANRLSYFKQRFKGVRYFISPDYSLLGDIHTIENIYRIFMSRVVAIWLIKELGAIVIPNISFPSENYCKIALNGLEKCSVVAISTKGHISNFEEQERLRKNIQLTVNTLNLEAIIVYDVCGTDSTTLDIFSYAIEKGIKVIIPDNTLKRRNVGHFMQKAVG